ncbi:RsmB/NOP family class I SAM-dependent RNA methyltransferase [Kiloniella laminariae]|uniref:RsmB/NOP family class I SAM-dependent RNA methyltransferase n=1 Tax=Kiloniella laminariae TaxID=454162 RepID=A0ABT4LH55_9PROT|nr:RsmB/NOP family class I SAM-dependent RNA methyltransferase [Kiloniella laminariae]MCZ4280429.1 RsmB/NOP family class I SAM-dependent RNA methyltransferase [Kiloniella laminariae]
MKPSGRIQTTIELLSEVLESSLPMDRVVTNYLRARRFIGSGDRRDISGRIYGVIRSMCRLDWWTLQAGLEGNSRSLVLAYSLLAEGLKVSDLEIYCDGGQHSPEPLSLFEGEALATLEGFALDHPDMSPAVLGELPDWLFSLFEQQYGAEQARSEVAGLKGEASIDLRVNILRGKRDEVLEQLVSDGIACEKTGHSPWGLRVEGRTTLGNSRAYREGQVEVQDEGSQMIALLCDARPGMSVIDLCAGAGGKTLALAASMENDGDLVAMDVDPKRLQRAEPRVSKAGVGIVRYARLDKVTLRGFAVLGFDRVLVDAPCSGSGTWRRQPDARLHLTRERLDHYRSLQLSVLDQAAPCVKPGGRLIYATCSLFAEENEQQVAAFLKKHPDFTQMDARLVWQSIGGKDCPFQRAAMQLTPAQHGLDGFFCAVLEKAS